MRNRSLMALLSVAPAVLAFSTWAQPAGTTQVVALEGSKVSGGNTVFCEFQPASVNDSGASAFLAILSDSSGSCGRFAEKTLDVARATALGQPALMQRNGQPFPDLTGNINLLGMAVAVFPPFILENSETIVTQSGPFEVFYSDGANLDQLPGSETGIKFGQRLFSAGLPFSNARGDLVADLVLLDRATNQELGEGLFRISRDGAVSSIAQLGEPTGVSDFVFEEIAGLRPASGEYAHINASGEVVFTAEINSPSSRSTAAIFLGDGNDLKAIAISGEEVPDSDATFESFTLFPMAINEHGQVALYGTLVDNVTKEFDPALLFHDGNSLQVVARSGEVAPGGIGRFGDNLFFPTAFSHPVLDNSGAVVFFAGLTGTSLDAPSNFAVFRRDAAGEVKLLFYVGGPAPSGDGVIEFIFSFASNGAGQVVFAADIRDTSNNRPGNALLFYDPRYDGLMNVVQTGHTLLLDRPVDDIELLGASIIPLFTSSMEAGSYLNELGQVAYSFNSDLGSDRSGIALWTPPVIDSSIMLPNFRVNVNEPSERTGFVSIHNHSGTKSENATVTYLNADGDERQVNEVEIKSRQTLNVTLNAVAGLETDGAGLARGAARIDLESDAGYISGDYLFVDGNDDFASGSTLLRADEICTKVQIRLLDFGSGATLRLFATEPMGQNGPTARYKVFNESGDQVTSGSIFSDQMIETLNGRDLTDQRFGTLEIEFVEGEGALMAEYSAFGKFSVGMNGNCVDRVDSSPLILPGFEVGDNGRTTFLSIHNVSDRSQEVSVAYLDQGGVEQSNVVLPLEAKQTTTINLADVDGLTEDSEGIIRGAAIVRSNSGVPLTGDYIFLDPVNNFAAGSQLVRGDSICDRIQVRLLDFGSGNDLLLYATDPQGASEPTGTFRVFDNEGVEVENGSLFAESEVLSVGGLTDRRFGILQIDFVAGGGALIAKYNAFGRFSVAMNAACTGAAVPITP